RICVLDEAGRVLTVNRAWRIALDGDQPGALAREGDDYADACASSPLADADSMRFLAGLRDVLGGSRNAFAMEYSCDGADDRRWFVMRVSRFDIDGSERFVVSHQDITERRQAEERERQSAALLDIAGEMARIGGWAYDVGADRMSWSKEVAAIHEVQEVVETRHADAHYLPDLGRALAFYDRHCPRVAECLEVCVRHGEPFDEEVELTTA